MIHGQNPTTPADAYQGVRCPWCSRKLAEALPGSALRLRCPRCKQVFERRVE